MNRSDDSLPDVLVGGHYHIDDCTRARGVKCIQPGAFQNETDFMAGSEAHPTGGGILWVQTGEWGRVYWYAFFEFNRQGEYIGNTNPNQ
jgi:2',3'-cyclic-nucleotide 2'-phosphodiesterase (5'-nucleotidase family)